MLKAIRFTLPASKLTASQPDYHQLAPIALFCGIGLLVSLIAVLSGVQGAWY